MKRAAKWLMTATASLALVVPLHHPASYYRCGNFQAKRGYEFEAFHDGTANGTWLGFKGQVIGYGSDESTTIYPQLVCLPRPMLCAGIAAPDRRLCAG